MKIGYTGWTWISNEFDDWNPINERHKENFERYLRDISDLGWGARRSASSRSTSASG